MSMVCTGSILVFLRLFSPEAEWWCYAANYIAVAVRPLWGGHLADSADGTSSSRQAGRCHVRSHRTKQRDATYESILARIYSLQVQQILDGRRADQRWLAPLTFPFLPLLLELLLSISRFTFILQGVRSNVRKRSWPSRIGSFTIRPARGGMLFRMIKAGDSRYDGPNFD